MSLEPQEAGQKGEEGGEEVPLIMPLVEVGGILMPLIFQSNRPLPEHVAMLGDLEMRHDDVLVLAYPKAGTHWTWEVSSMLLAGKAEYEPRSKVLAMLEATPIEDINSLPSPRVFNSHLPLRLLPRQVRDKKVKVVHVYRNPKDVFVSAFFHFQQIPGAEGLTMESLERPFFTGKVAMGSYIDYLKAMEQYRKDNPEVPFYTLSFEDMKEDPEREIGRLAEFLGVEASAQLCADIAQATSFSNLKEADQKKEQSHLPPAKVFRKGEVGDWKNYLTVAQSERFDDVIRQLQSGDYNFRYEL